MLVLTRKAREKVYIGSDICITVVRLDGGQVRLGIEAPRQVPVVRAELVHGPSRTPAGPRAPVHGPAAPHVTAGGPNGSPCPDAPAPLTGHVRPGSCSSRPASPER